MTAPIDRIENVRALVEDVQRQMDACRTVGVEFSPVFAWQLLSACRSLLGQVEDAKREGAVEALEKAAADLEQQGVEPWDRNSVAISTLRLQIAHLREEQ